MEFTTARVNLSLASSISFARRQEQVRFEAVLRHGAFEPLQTHAIADEERVGLADRHQRERDEGRRQLVRRRRSSRASTSA